MSAVLGLALGLLQIHLHLPVLLRVGRLFSFVNTGLGPSSSRVLCSARSCVPPLFFAGHCFISWGEPLSTQFPQASVPKSHL